jgi:hypothetical protein
LGDFFGVWGELDRVGLNPRIFVDRAWANVGCLKGDIAYFARYFESFNDFVYPWGSFHELACRSVLYLSYISDKRCNREDHFGDLFNGGRGSFYYTGFDKYFDRDRITR